MSELTPEQKHTEEWTKLYEIYSADMREEFQYRARCVQGLLSGTTLDYN